MSADKSRGIDVVQVMTDTLTKEINKQILNTIIEEHEREIKEKIEVRKNKLKKIK